MALGDYILCCKCGVKLIYDGDRRGREWWEARFGKPPEIECPDCKAPASKPLTDEQINEHRLALGYDHENLPDPWDFKQGVKAAERAHGIKENT